MMENSVFKIFKQWKITPFLHKKYLYWQSKLNTKLFSDYNLHLSIIIFL